MSERDSVHTEIEKLQEKVEAREARISQLEKKKKEHEGEVITFSFSHFNRAWKRRGEERRGERRNGKGNRFSHTEPNAWPCTFHS